MEDPRTTGALLGLLFGVQAFAAVVQQSAEIEVAVGQPVNLAAA
jgi:hypothetical protein